MHLLRIAIASGAFVLAGTSFAQDVKRAAPARSHELKEVPSIAPEDVALGSCVSGSNIVDLSDVYFLRDAQLRRKKRGGGRTLMTIQGQSVAIQEQDKDTGSLSDARIFDLTFHIKSATPIDIELNFVLLNQEPAVYWKETYQHRSYRQGIFKFDDKGIVSVCEGVGGIDASH